MPYTRLRSDCGSPQATEEAHAEAETAAGPTPSPEAHSSHEGLTSTAAAHEDNERPHTASQPSEPAPDSVGGESTGVDPSQGPHVRHAMGPSGPYPPNMMMGGLYGMNGVPMSGTMPHAAVASHVYGVPGMSPSMSSQAVDSKVNMTDMGRRVASLFMLTLSIFVAIRGLVLQDRYGAYLPLLHDTY